MHVQSNYASDLSEARRVVAEHGWARVTTAGEAGLRATYGFFLLEDSADDEVVVAGHCARADPQLSQAMPRPVRERIVERLDAPGSHHHPELAALMRRLSLANP